LLADELLVKALVLIAVIRGWVLRLGIVCIIGDQIFVSPVLPFLMGTEPFLLPFWALLSGIYRIRVLI